MSTDRRRWPILVRFVLWRLPNRLGAWISFWVSTALAIASVAFGFANPVFFVGSLLFLASLGYYLAIRWVDRHGQWG